MASPLLKLIEAARRVTTIAERLESDWPPDSALIQWPDALDDLIEAAEEWKKHRDLRRSCRD